MDDFNFSNISLDNEIDRHLPQIAHHGKIKSKQKTTLSVLLK